MIACLFAFAAVAGLPSSEDVSAAVADATPLGTAAVDVRYLSLSTIDPDRRGEVAAVVSYALNHVSRSSVVVRPTRVSDRLLRIDLAAVAPDPTDRAAWAAAWDRLATADPYYHLRTAVLADGKEPTEVYTDGGWIDLTAAAELRQLTGSPAAILDARWWVEVALSPPAYWELTGIPETRAEWVASLGVDRAAVDSLDASQGANLVRSGVTGKPRRISRWPSPSGAIWNTYDVRRADGVHDPIRDPTFSGPFRYDAGEFIATRPNGLHEYFIADADGRRVEFVDPAIATDYTLGVAGVLVPAASCIRCHTADAVDDGLKPFADVTAKLLAAPGVELFAADPATAAELAGFYGRGPRLETLLARDREDYAAAVALATGGMSPVEAGAAFAALGASYRSLVSPADACRELGLSDRPDPSAALGAAFTATTDPVLLLLVSGLAVDRVAWESSYSTAALRIAEVAARPSQGEPDDP